MSYYRIITDYYSCTYKNNEKVRDLNSKFKSFIQKNLS